MYSSCQSAKTHPDYVHALAHLGRMFDSPFMEKGRTVMVGEFTGVSASSEVADSRCLCWTSLPFISHLKKIVNACDINLLCNKPASTTMVLVIGPAKAGMPDKQTGFKQRQISFSGWSAEECAEWHLSA